MKISVAMGTYNGENFILKQLDSIINQSVMVDEIIICDDGSKDNTINIIKEYKKNCKVEIKLFQNRKNLGVINNFRKAFSKCSGDIIFLCDQDDIWDKDKVKKITKEFKNKKFINMIGTNALLIDQNDNSLNHNLWDFVNYNYVDENYKYNYKVQLKHAILTGATAAVRKSFVDKFMFESKYVIHDYWLSECASITNSLLMIDENLTLYRQHSNNVVGVKKKNKIKFFLSRIFKVNYYYKFYTKNYNQYLELYNYFVDNGLEIGDNEDYLKKCIYFWKVRSELNSYTLKELIKVLNQLKRENLYQKYSSKKQVLCVIFDIYYYLIIKLIRRNKNV